MNEKVIVPADKTCNDVIYVWEEPVHHLLPSPNKTSTACW